MEEKEGEKDEEGVEEKEGKEEEEKEGVEEKEGEEEEEEEEKEGCFLSQQLTGMDQYGRRVCVHFFEYSHHL